MLLILLLQVTSPTATPAADTFAKAAWGSFARSPALARRREQVEIATDGRDGRSGPLHYKLRLTVSTLNEREVLWINSRTCPAVRAVIGSLRDLQPPRPMPPGFDEGEMFILMDGIGYELAMPALDRNNASTIRWHSNVQTPLAAWIDGSFLALEPCWSPVELRVMPDGKP